MPKNARNGQAEIFSEEDYRKLLGKMNNPKHRIFFLIARYTGERWGAIRQLEVSDVYEDPYLQQPKKEILFKGSTRKGDRHGKRSSRAVPVHPDLDYELSRYKCPKYGWLFPGSNPDNPISFDALDKYFRQCLRKAKLHRRGFSSHSTRRTFVTSLWRKGIDLKTLQELTGHQSISALELYIEADPKRKAQAIALL